MIQTSVSVIQKEKTWILASGAEPKRIGKQVPYETSEAVPSVSQNFVTLLNKILTLFYRRNLNYYNYPGYLILPVTDFYNINTRIYSGQANGSGFVISRSQGPFHYYAAIHGEK